MPLDVTAVMSGLATALNTNISNGMSALRAYAYPPDQVAPPAAVVGFPDQIEYDFTMARPYTAAGKTRLGRDRMDIPVHLIVGKVSDRASAPQLTNFLAGANDFDGASVSGSSVKYAIEVDETLGGACETVRVTGATVSVMTIAAIDYLAASFLVEVVG